MTDNIIKHACKELGITQKELAERIGVSEGMPSKWAMDGAVIPEWGVRSIKLLLENKSLKEKIEVVKAFQELKL